jgi:hypothetical protein
LGSRFQTTVAMADEAANRQRMQRPASIFMLRNILSHRHFLGRLI